MMIGWEDYPYHFIEWPEEKQKAYLEECPAFDPTSSRANHREQGILCEYLRTFTNAYRSNNPTHAFAGAGHLAREIMEEHPLQYGCGPGSPLEKLVCRKGKVLNLGAPLTTLTVLHYAEHIAEVNNKLIARYKMPLLRDGRRLWVDIEEYDTSKGIAPCEGDYFELIAQEYLKLGTTPCGSVGKARSYLFDAADLVLFGKNWMEQHFNAKQEASGGP